MTGMLPPPLYPKGNTSTPSGFWRRIVWSRSPGHGLFQRPLRTLQQWKYESQIAFLDLLQKNRLKVKIKDIKINRSLSIMIWRCINPDEDS